MKLSWFTILVSDCLFWNEVNYFHQRGSSILYFVNLFEPFWNWMQFSHIFITLNAVKVKPIWSLSIGALNIFHTFFIHEFSNLKLLFSATFMSWMNESLWMIHDYLARILEFCRFIFLLHLLLQSCQFVFKGIQIFSTKNIQIPPGLSCNIRSPGTRED